MEPIGWIVLALLAATIICTRKRKPKVPMSEQTKAYLREHYRNKKPRHF